VHERHGRYVVLIGVVKLAKASLLLTIGGVCMLAGAERMARIAEGAALWLGAMPGRHVIHRVALKLWSLDGGDARKLAVLSLAYAAVFAVEGVGLVMEKAWAEWMTVGVTASFIPIEIYEIVVHFGPGKIVALVLNVLIVIYLLAVRLGERHGRAAPGTVAPQLAR
jgi:uncharacterized membrane protein (DUF2068 family)